MDKATPPPLGSLPHVLSTPPSRPAHAPHSSCSGSCAPRLAACSLAAAAAWSLGTRDPDVPPAFVLLPPPPLLGPGTFRPRALATSCLERNLRTWAGTRGRLCAWEHART